jgi:hypothetical protein
MSKKGDAPPAPDYSFMAQSSLESAKLAQQTSREQLDWSKQQYADQAPLTKAYMQQMVDSSKKQDTITDENMANARTDRARYQSTYQPVEDQFVKTAQGYNAPARAQERSAAAQADVATAFAGQRHAALQSLEGYGIDPSQTRYGALDLGARISQAAAQASAGTTARNQTEATALALQGEAINIGKGYPGQIANAYGTAINAGQAGAGMGSQGISAGLNTSNTYGNMMGNPTTWGSLSNQSMGMGINAQNAGFQNQMAGFNANSAIAQNQASGIGSMVGAAVGIGAIAI